MSAVSARSHWMTDPERSPNSKRGLRVGGMRAREERSA